MKPEPGTGPSLRSPVRRLMLTAGCLVVLLVAGLLVATGGARSADPIPPATMSLDEAVAWVLGRSDILALVMQQAERARIEEAETLRTADQIDEEAVNSYEVAVLKYLQPAAATSDRYIAERKVLATREDLILQVRLAYFGVLTADRLVQVAHEAVSGATQHVRVANAFYTAGMVPRKDVLDAEARKAEIEAGLATALRAQGTARLGLGLLLGLEPGKLSALSTGAAVPPIDCPEDDGKWVGLAQAVRFESIQMDEAVTLSALNLQLAEEYPSGGSVPWSLIPDDWLPPDWAPPDETEPSWERSERYTIPVARSQYQEALLGRRLRRDEIGMQVRTAFLDIQEAQRRVELLAISAAASREGLRLERLRYEAGMSTSLEVMAAQISLSQAESQQARAAWELESARARFVHVCSVGSRSSQAAPSAGTR